MHSILGLVFFSAFTFTAHATERHVTISSTAGSVLYTPTAGKGSCHLSLDKPETATILQENADYVQVSFDSMDIHGCYWDFMGKDKNTGWIPKKAISIADTAEATPSTASTDDDDANVKVLPAAPPDTEMTAPLPSDCPPREGQVHDSVFETDPTIHDVADLINHIRAKDSGMKSLSEVKKYISCYPLSAKGDQNLKKLEPFLDQITSSFSIEYRSEALMVNPSLFRCLLRRESGFDPASLSYTGAVGIGQHTNINIETISKQINNPRSWQHKLWAQFFQSAQKSPEGRALLKSCRGGIRKGVPTFNNKKDAACPLQSLAASGLYILEIQKALMQSSSTRRVAWDKNLEYQLAIGASYNLGDGAAGKAVDDLVLDGWIDAIKNKPGNKQKKQEVRNHIAALKNCLEDKNWKPMSPGDHPVCQLPNNH